MASLAPMSAEELLRLSATGQRCELVQGVLRRMSPAGGEHGAICATLTESIGRHVRARRLGRVYAAETGFVLARRPDTVRAPDVAFVAMERAERLRLMRGYLPEPPDLAIEVLSPGDPRREVESKVQSWLAAGTRAVVVVDPASRRITVRRAGTADETLSGTDVLRVPEVVPGWEIGVAEVFE